MSSSDLLAPRVVPLFLRKHNCCFPGNTHVFSESTVVLFRKGQLIFSESTVVPLQKAQFVFYPPGGYIWVSGPPGDLEVQLAGISVWVARQATWRSSWRVYLGVYGRGICHLYLSFLSVFCSWRLYLIFCVCRCSVVYLVI